MTQFGEREAHGVPRGCVGMTMANGLTKRPGQQPLGAMVGALFLTITGCVPFCADLALVVALMVGQSMPAVIAQESVQVVVAQAKGRIAGRLRLMTLAAQCEVADAKPDAARSWLAALALRKGG